MSFFDDMKNILLSKMQNSYTPSSRGGYDTLLKMVLGSLGSGGLQSLIQKLSQSGLKDKVDSWIRKGKNDEVSQEEISQALGPDVIQDLSRKTGMNNEEVSQSLASMLPDIVDQNTPDGHLDEHTVDRNTRDLKKDDTMKDFKGLFG
jgi:uncharacterized protein YidB (DUF937 family)